jgi:hypothetical protein
VSKNFSRWLAGVAVLALFAQNGPLAAVAQSSYPVATNIEGSVALIDRAGNLHHVATAQIIHSGETVLTGVNSMAVVQLADVGRVLLGPATRALTNSDGSNLSMQLATGSVCVESVQPNVQIQAGPLSVSAGAPNAIFDLQRRADRTEFAVYEGTVNEATGVSKQSTAVSKGNAQVLTTLGSQPADMRAVSADFSSLGCPDAGVVAAALPPPATGGGGGSSAGGIIGALLGIGAIVAAVSHGGNSSASSSGEPIPQPTTRTPTPAPTGPTPPPTPTPSILPSLPPSPSPPPSLLPTPTPTPSDSPTPQPSSASLSVMPQSLSFSAPGAPPQNIRARDPHASQFSATSSNSAVAEVVPAGPLDDHRAQFSVIPVGDGSAAIEVSDNAGGSASVSVTVGPNAAARHGLRGRLTVQPSMLTLRVGQTAPFSVTEAGYTGAFRAAASSSAVTLSLPMSAGPSAAFTVIGRSAGAATVRIVDDFGGLQTVRVLTIR